MSNRKSLKQHLKGKSIIRSLGTHDAISALIAEQAGFETLFVGGFGVSASRLGQPDLNLLSLMEMADVVKKITTRISVPVVADGDTGHGGVHNVFRTVREFHKAGAAGMIIEDQVAPKRCGHFQGKDIVSVGEMLARIRAANAARGKSDFILIARTDARDVTGLSEAIRRVNLYKKAGADVVFIESPHTEAELALIPKKVKAPLLVNMLTGGKTPNLPVSKLEKMGYKIVVYPIESVLILVKGVQRLAKNILEAGHVNQLRDDMVSFSEIKTFLGLKEK